MKSIKHLLSLSFFLFTIATFAQHPVIKFDKKMHDFGTFKEEEGRVKARFEFTNTGEADLVIKNVRASCGCTAPSYSKKAVKPGEKGYIEAIYNASNRPGPFRKSITVTYNNPDKAQEVLFIKGNVIRKSKTRADDFRRTIGSLKLMENSINFGKVKNTEIKKDSILVYNNSVNPMKFSIEKADDNISVSFPKNPLPSRSEMYIYISIDGEKTSEIGNIHQLITFRTDDHKNPMKAINIVADISQDFSNYSKRDLKRAPKIEFDATTYDFGTKKSGDAITHKFTFKNTGKKDLKILKIEPSCGCTSAKLSSEVIEKKSEAYLEVIFDSKRKLNNQHYTIKLITNDPENPEIYLHIQGTLER